MGALRASPTASSPRTSIVEEFSICLPRPRRGSGVDCIWKVAREGTAVGPGASA